MSQFVVAQLLGGDQPVLPLSHFDDTLASHIIEFEEGDNLVRHKLCGEPSNATHTGEDNDDSGWDRDRRYLQSRLERDGARMETLPHSFIGRGLVLARGGSAG